jgi:hypothetical protein
LPGTRREARGCPWSWTTGGLYSPQSPATPASKPRKGPGSLAGGWDQPPGLGPAFQVLLLSIPRVCLPLGIGQFWIWTTLTLLPFTASDSSYLLPKLLEGFAKSESPGTKKSMILGDLREAAELISPNSCRTSSLLVRGLHSRAMLPGFKCWCCCLLSVIPQRSYISSLCLLP